MISSRCLQEDILQTRLQDVLEDIKCYAEGVFKTSLARLHQDECLVGMFLSYKLTSARDVASSGDHSIIQSEKSNKKMRSAKPVMLE